MPDLDFSGGPLNILKWIGIVLAAGFIGYFGRYLSMLIIERLHRKKPEPLGVAPGKSPSSGTENVVVETVAAGTETAKSQLKIAKKRAKQAEKKAKKGS
ncbi:MAG: hypothetical protein Q7I94_03430 [Candidatus Contubernalis sp.]|nr:hypothetical protein [Candidatus Contubernalis sp.]